MVKRILRAIRVGIAAILALIVAVLVYLRVTSPRYREFDTREFLEQKGFKAIALDAQMQRMIKRAQLDYILFPEPRPRSLLDFQVAKQRDDLLYLMFRPSWNHSAVVYAYSTAERKPLWRTEVGLDDD